MLGMRGLFSRKIKFRHKMSQTVQQHIGSHVMNLGQLWVMTKLGLGVGVAGHQAEAVGGPSGS